MSQPADRPRTATPAALNLTGRLFPSGDPVSVEIRAGKIAAVKKSALPAENAERWLVPGLFDLQLNGFAGRDFLSPQITVADCEHIARAALATGTTRFLATIITGPFDRMCHQLDVIATAIESSPLFGRLCQGIHAEGPFLNADDGPRGAHPAEHVRPPNLADYTRLREAARGHLRILTLAPEQPDAIKLIRQAVRDGVIVALGHHRAEQPAIDAAIAAGARMCTHLGNGLDSTVPRLDNPLWRQLGDDRLHASFICDGHHLPPRTMKCLLRAKTPERSILITDSVAPARMPPGRYRVGSTDVELTHTGKVVLPGTPYLAGSAADMPLVVGRAVVDGGLTFQQAITMATANPAALLALPPLWPPATGQDANILELDWTAASGQITIRHAIAGPFAAP